MQRTLVLLKPDCVQRRLMGKIIARFEDKGLNIVAMKMIQVTPEMSRQHYAEHVEKPFYPSLESFITSAPVVAMAIDGLEVVKVVRDMEDHAIYFSRATIPYPREAASGERASRAALHHHGIYAYRCGVLRRLVAAEPSELEICEQLEQLRALYYGAAIHVADAASPPGPGVDTEADLARAEALLAGA